MTDFLYVVWALVLSWRFLVAVALAATAIFGVFSVVPDRATCTGVAAVIAVAALVFGFAWQRRGARGRFRR